MLTAYCFNKRKPDDLEQKSKNHVTPQQASKKDSKTAIFITANKKKTYFAV